LVNGSAIWSIGRPITYVSLQRLGGDSSQIPQPEDNSAPGAASLLSVVAKGRTKNPEPMLGEPCYFPSFLPPTVIYCWVKSESSETGRQTILDSRGLWLVVIAAHHYF
jgi:hypothetical protein